MKYYGDDGKLYQLGNEIGSGGEACVYEVIGHPEKVAKIFKERKLNRERKIKVLSHLPWPADVRQYLVLPDTPLYEDSAQRVFKGYIMEKVDCSCKLSDAYSETHPLSTYKRSCVAESLCKAVIAVHKLNGIAIGDFNSKNILVDRASGKIRIVDVDSLHITVNRNGKKETYPCAALDPNLFMPEILNKFQEQRVRSLEDIKGETFTKYTDYYCLAYHIHILLMTQKPYGAALCKSDIQNSRPAPTINSMACKGQYAYVNLPARTLLPKTYPDFDIITPKLQSLFIRAFRDGSSKPWLRPNAQEFLSALEEYTAGLRLCHCDGFDHYLYKDYSKSHCEWCRVEQVRQQERKVTFVDMKWMTEDELLRYIEISEKSSRAEAYLILGKRYSGTGSDGVPAAPDISKSKKYLRKSISCAKTANRADCAAMAKALMNRLN